MFKIYFTPSGQKDLERLPKDMQNRIVKKLTFFASQPDPLAFSKPLVSLPPTTHRFRVGDYRVAFYVFEESLFVDRIKHRREVYKG